MGPPEASVTRESAECLAVFLESHRAPPGCQPLQAYGLKD